MNTSQLLLFPGAPTQTRKSRSKKMSPLLVSVRVQPGDVWQMGRHRLLCGNSLEREAVQRLMCHTKAQMVWSDPPYGISIVATNGYVGGGEAYGIPFGGVKRQRLGSSDGAKPFGKVGRISIGMKAKPIIEQGKYAPVIGDETTETATSSYQLLSELYPKAIHIWWGANHYANALPPSSCWLVWDKQNGASFFADCELAWCSKKSAVRIFHHMWNGLMKASERGQRRVHPTQKPIALAEWAFEKYGKLSDIILDPFCGSGMSVIAGERLGRSVYAIEMSSDYCDIILARWERETGQRAILLERQEVAA